jgi:hypothetical protein
LAFTTDLCAVVQPEAHRENLLVAASLIPSEKDVYDLL